MKLEEYIENLKLDLTGGILNLELNDKQLESVVKKSLWELQRYTNETKLMTIPFSKCIDLTNSNISAVVNVYRPNKSGEVDTDKSEGISSQDPMSMQQWMVYSTGYGMYNLSDWLMNYSAYNTMQQISNTSSTDLAYKFDKSENKLYVNTVDSLTMITIEYIPIYQSVEDVKMDYWQDMLYKLSLANTKRILGRIRTKFSQTNPLWETDGATILEEGNTEYKELIELLRANSQVTYVLD